MPIRAVELCKPCLNRKYPLTKQLLLAFLSVTVVSLLLALAVVVGTTVIVGDTAKERARRSLEEQIERHLKNASTEAAAIIGEKLRRLQDAVLEVSAFALRDTLQEDIVLAGGSEGYPLSPAHTDLRDTEIAASTEATLGDFHRQNIQVDLTRSVWYYSNETSFTATSSAEDMFTVGQTARLDILWPTMYANSINTKAVFVGIPLSASARPAFRYFPGGDLSGEPGTFYACEGGDSSTTCFNPAERRWYELAAADATDISAETGLGDVVITEPYIGASGSEGNWMVTIARAVYGDTDSTSDQLLGVVGVDVLLEAVQEFVEEITLLESGYSILATKKEGVILAAPTTVWDRNETDKNTTVCAAANGMCADHAWEELLSGEVISFESTSFSDDGEKIEAILIAAPVMPTFDSGTDDGVITHYIISAVPRVEIFAEADRMFTSIDKSSENIWVVTVSVAAATLVAVAVVVCATSRRITRSISKMASAAHSIANYGAETDVFGSVAAMWKSERDSGCTPGCPIVGGSTSRGKSNVVDYLLCRGEDEISILSREFLLMITGLGKRGAAARATGLDDSPEYPKNPFITKSAGVSRAALSAPSAPYVG